jgi:class 3 adenylate cyclase
MSDIDEHLLWGSEARLWKLIEQRTRSDADTEAIDSQIWEVFGEEWAVMFTDLTGFSRQTDKFGIIHFLQVIYEQRQLLLPIVDDHAGFLVKNEADSLLLLFRNAKTAYRCAVDMQVTAQKASARRVVEEKILLCVGIGHGKILRIGEHDAWGAEVNAASKLGEDTATTDEILITGAARDAIGSAISPDELELLDVDVPGSARNYRVNYSKGTI